MNAKYPHAFSPIQIGPVEIPNRFYFAPHGTPFSVGGGPSDDFAYYYAERAAGGVGLLFHSLGFTKSAGRPSPYTDATVPSFKAVADLVHERGAKYGTKLFAQLHYVWASPGQWAPLSPQPPALGPSCYPGFDNLNVTRALTTDEIGRFIDMFRRSARNLAQAGYDGVEVHTAHAMLHDHFLSAFRNRRTDVYGGSVANRMRFLVETLQAVRDAVGATVAVGIRFNWNELLPGGLTESEAREILSSLAEQKLIDFADIDIATAPNQAPLGTPAYFAPKFGTERFVATVRDVLGSIPVLSTLGRVTSAADAERALADGSCDLVGATRGLIAEPEFVKNAMEGREERSRVCIACNLCLNPAATGAFGCAINPASGRERRWGVTHFEPAAQRQKVVVVGAGPAGLEAARVAALRGHDVVLLERGGVVGGQMNTWAKLPGRDVFATTPLWYRGELDELGVDVRTGVDADAQTVLGESPDAVVIATGASYARDGESGFIPAPIPGWDQDFVYAPEQIIDGGERPSGRIVVLDDEGLNTGAGVAEMLAEAGADVELMTRRMTLVEHLFYTAEYAFIIPRLKNLGIKITRETYLSKIGDHRLTAYDVFTNAAYEIEGVDAVVLVTMRRPDTALAAQLEGKVGQLFPVGDALAPRGLREATFEGQMFARMLGEPDAPTSFADAYFAPYPADSFPKPAAAISA
jgi:2,4-dienoyl-CoA reductase-like NADH-dependent reductase (Old Yellow Enzyme family)/thioredoxin reductase